MITSMSKDNSAYYKTLFEEATEVLTGYKRVRTYDAEVENYYKKNDKATTETADNVIKYVRGGVRVINYNGTVLPTTGGLGTTLFIAIGSLVALMAAVVLVTNKRMANETI